MNYSSMKKAPNSRDEPMLCLHVTGKLPKKKNVIENI